MQVGAIYPQIELRGDPEAFDAFGRAVERLGYDHLLMFDHVAGAERGGRMPDFFAPYDHHDPFHDPLVAFGYMAGVTERIELVTGVLILPQRPTVLVGRQAADVDLLSGGRLRLGVGVGWSPVEYEALGQDFHTRGKRLDEQIVLLRSLWETAPIDFQGAFDRIDRAGLNPRPKRRIPIWCGGGSSAAYARAARIGDGFIFSGPYADQIVPGWKQLQSFLVDAGRDPATFGAEYLISESLTPGDAVEMAKRWQDIGGTHVGVRTMGMGFTDVRQHIDFLADVRAHLEPAGGSAAGSPLAASS